MPLERYKSWVRSHSGLVTAIEGALQSAVWLLPERFSDSELKCEALNSALGLISLYHASIIDGESTRAGRSCWPLLLSAIQQVEVLVEIGAGQWCSKAKGRNKFDVLCVLEVIKLVLRLLTLHEDGGRILLDAGCTADGYAAGSTRETRHDEPTRQQVILETFSRFRDSRARRAELERAAAAWASKHRDPGGRETGDEDRDRPGSPKAAVYWWDQPGCDPGKRRPEGLDRRPVACDQQRSYWWDDPGEEGWETPPEARKAAEGSREGGGQEGARGWAALWPELPADLLKPRYAASFRANEGLQPMGSASATLCRRLFRSPLVAEDLLVAGELLHLARPLLYCLLLRKCGVRSWRPWLAALAVDLASSRALSLAVYLSNSRLSSAAYRDRYTSKAYSLSLNAMAWSQPESQELSRRRLSLLFYLIRSPAFESATRPALQAARVVTSHLPLVGFLADKAVEILEGIQHYYTYTSAS